MKFTFKSLLKTMSVVVCGVTMMFSQSVWAFGDVVYDPTVDATLETNFAAELAKHAEEVSHLLTQITLIKQSLEQLQNPQWNIAQDKINELGNAVNKVNGLAYNSSNLDERFRQLYPGYGNGSSAMNYSEQYKNIVTTTQNTINGVLQSLGLNAQDFANENTRLQMLQNQAQNADGQTKAIQASAQIASATVEQVQMLRQTMIAQTNAQNAYYAAQIQKEANVKRALDDELNNCSTTITGELDQHPTNSKW